MYSYSNSVFIYLPPTPVIPTDFASPSVHRIWIAFWRLNPLSFPTHSCFVAYCLIHNYRCNFIVFSPCVSRRRNLRCRYALKCNKPTAISMTLRIVCPDLVFFSECCSDNQGIDVKVRSTVSNNFVHHSNLPSGLIRQIWMTKCTFPMQILLITVTAWGDSLIETWDSTLWPALTPATTGAIVHAACMKQLRLMNVEPKKNIRM